ncbi:GH3 domain-containing protein [Apodemus speciosus]|uniref:GH3 domain-containing protein n=1 Tax=Apodemus speciosus TaxID=105296 RepID=A0ABQ0FC57_APOSI
MPLCRPTEATLLGLITLNKAYPEALAPGSTACVTPTSPWPCSVPWLGHALGRVSPVGAKDARTLLLEALLSPGLRVLEARTAAELLDVFVGLEADGEELAEALAAGSLGRLLPTRAAELQEALEQGPRGLALRLWPKLQVVVTLDSGGQAEAVAALRVLWCQGLAFFSPAYAASGGQLDAGIGCSSDPCQDHSISACFCSVKTRNEQAGPGEAFPERLYQEVQMLGGAGPVVQSEALPSAVAWQKGMHHEVDKKVVWLSIGVIALNLWPEQPQGSYLLPPGVPFIELLPIKEGTQEGAASTLLLTDAQKEEDYELVLTDATSLTRCRLGDVVRVVGTYNQCPVVRFTCRLGQTLSIRGEVTDETVFSAALAQAVEQWPGAKLLDHVCVESSILDSWGGSAPHYEVFVELRGLRNLSEENRDKLDHCLQDASPQYKSLRLRGSVSPAKVHLVGPGSFRVLREALAACPCSAWPPEMPRVLRLRRLAQLLQKRVLS